MIRLLIFDFDGTIANTKNAYYSSIYRNLKKRGFNKKEVVYLIDKGLNLKQTLDKIRLSFIQKWILKMKIIKDVKYFIKDVKKCKNTDKIKGINIKKILVSNSTKSLINPIIKHLKLKNLFYKIYGADDFSDKASFIKNYLKENKINSKECCYIGDRVADINVAKVTGCISIIISGKCAWNSKKDLEKANPDFLIDDFSNLNKILISLTR